MENITMKELKLTKLNNPNEKKLNEMKSALKDILDEDLSAENLQTILDFQDEDGSFKMYTTYKIPSDARVDFCHEPTYICSAILMKAYLTGDSTLKERIEYSLIDGLEMSTMRNLRGHGLYALEGQIESLNIFMKGGLREFIDLYGELNAKFTEMILNIIIEFEKLEEDKVFKGPWGEDYKEKIISINEYFNSRNVFVYGTLMKGESNHGLLEESRFIGARSIEGYEMYNAGWYPAIIPGESIIPGELYEVPERDIQSLDMLEGEGSLYIRKCELTDSKDLTYIYEYAQDISEFEKISSWNRDYIWYVSYGSNMLYERFRCYIEGGSYKDSRYHPPCDDTTLPIAVKAVDISYDMYFGNSSGSWQLGGVSFLNTTKEGHALGVAYLITREQFKHVAAEENTGRFPDGTGSWYEDIITLGEMGGFELVTVTNNELRPYNEPCEDYFNTLKDGIRQNWPEMPEEDIDSYLNSCIRK